MTGWRELAGNGGPQQQTLFYVLNLYQNAFEFHHMGYASALAWVLFVLVLILTIIVFRGSKPKLPFSERMSPRTATMEEVISTAQMAICTTSNRSRTVIRRGFFAYESDRYELLREEYRESFVEN